MRPKLAFLAASASIFAFAVADRAGAQSLAPSGPTAIGSTDFYSGLQAFGSFEDFGAFNDYNRGRNVSVLQRERPEYAAIGIPFSSYILYPRLVSGLGYTDNVYATTGPKDSDEFAEIDPQIIAQSTWSRNSLLIDAGGAFREFFSKSSEDENGGHLIATGRFDLAGASYAIAGANVQRTYEERTDSGFPVGAAAPVPYTTYGAFGRGVYQEGRIRASGSIDFRGFEFDDVPALPKDGGGTINQSFRNEDIVTIAGRGEYAPTPDTGVFGELAYVGSNYVSLVGVPDRSSHEYRVLAGTDFDLTALVRGEVGGGYVDREYNASAYRSISGFAFRGQVEYFPTPLTTLTVNASRSIQDAVIVNSGGYFSNLVGIKVDHELLRNLLLNAAATYEYDQFNELARHDVIGNLRVGFQYLLSRGVGINASYSYAKRESRAIPTLLGPEFNMNRLFIGLVLQR